LREIKQIIIHCSASDFGSAFMVDRWHKQNGWSGIGYHFVVLNGLIKKDLFIPQTDGCIEIGRDVSIAGAHVLNYNSSSIGICLIGNKTFTDAQMNSALNLCIDLIIEYDLDPDDVYGHYETLTGIEQNKTCPNFNMDVFRNDLSKLFYNVRLCEGVDDDTINKHDG